MTRIMYDGINPSSIPKDAEIVASYVDGKWPNYPQLKTLFPHALHLSIAVDPAHDAQCLDVERFDATPEQAPAWAARQRKRGNPYPWVYMNSATWSAVRAAFNDQSVPEPLYWVANYDGRPIIPAGAIGKQYRNTPGYDESVIADSIPGFDTEDDMTPDQVKAAVIAALQSPEGTAAVAHAVLSFQVNVTAKETDSVLNILLKDYLLDKSQTK